MKLLARYTNFNLMRANRARMLLLLALLQGQISIGQKDYQ